MKHSRRSTLKSVWLALASLFLIAPTVHAQPPAVTTQMYNNMHTGWNNQETQLTIANVLTNFKLLFTDKAEGQTYSQPLYVPTVNLGKRGTHNVIFVATETNTVYAFDADKAGKPLWASNLTPRGETLQVAADYENIRIPQAGISSTPVIDPATGTLYAVAASKTKGKHPVFHQRLHALDITTGKERPNSPVDIQAKFPGTGGEQDGQGNVVFDPLVEFNRAALTLFGNNVYTAWSAHEDIGNYQGWVIAYDKNTLAQSAVFNTSPSIVPDPMLGPGGSSIWQASIGMVADDSSIYAVTANGPFDANTGGPNYGDTVLQLGPGLNVTGYFTPCNQEEFYQLDIDLGSGAAMVLPDQTSGPTKLIVFAGKEGSIYLADRTSMGGYTPTQVCTAGAPCNVQCTNNVVQELWRVLGALPAISSDGANRDAFWGAPAYFQDSSGRQYIYYTGDYAPITEFDLANGTLTAGTNAGGAPNQTPSSEYNFSHGGTTPVISSNGGDPTTAIVWAVRHTLPPSVGPGPIELDAFSATDLTKEIVFDIPAGQWNFQNDPFLIPTVVNGKVYVFSGGELNVFGVTSTTPGGTGSIKIGSSINFGKVKVNSTKTKTFTVRNLGQGNLHVTFIPGAPFQVPGTGTLNLAPGQTSAPVNVQFIPTSPGPISLPLGVSCDDPKNPTPTFTLSGMGT
jgi:hypothetical protein